MAESTLSLNFNEINSHIARFLGYGSDPAQWAAENRQLDIDQCRRQGYRRFLYPTMLAGEKVRHSWTFLSPSYVLTMATGVADYNLPDDFGSLSGFITHSSLYKFTKIDVVGEWQIRVQRQSERSAIPTVAAIQPIASDGFTGQRWRIMVYPTPDQAYPISMCYNRIPDDLTGMRPYPLGGAQHSRTILEACLAEAERLRDDEYGVHNEAFMESLVASIQIDLRQRTPDYIGYNGDRSDDAGSFRNVDEITITMDGTTI